MISGLAQKDYDKKILKLTERELSQIRKITADYDEEEPTWEQQLKEWISETYKGKEFQEGTPLILHFSQKKQDRKFTGSMMAEWMIRYMPRMQ